MLFVSLLHSCHTKIMSSNPIGKLFVIFTSVLFWSYKNYAADRSPIKAVFISVMNCDLKNIQASWQDNGWIGDVTTSKKNTDISSKGVVALPEKIDY
jgi:hypothetical protein